MVLRPLLVLLAAALATAVAPASGTAVNRCVAQGEVLYTDQPCPGAQVVRLQPGASAPDARDRLRRDQDALDAGAAARRDALAREAALARMPAAPGDGGPLPSRTVEDPAYDFAYAPFGALRNGARRPDVRARERIRRHASVITQPPPTRLRGAPR